MYIGNIYPHISISKLIISLTSYQMYHDDSILVYKKTINSRLSYFKAERMHARVSKLFQEWFNNLQGIVIKLPRLWYITWKLILKHYITFLFIYSLLKPPHTVALFQCLEGDLCSCTSTPTPVGLGRLIWVVRKVSQDTPPPNIGTTLTPLPTILEKLMWIKKKFILPFLKIWLLTIHIKIFAW